MQSTEACLLCEINVHSMVSRLEKKERERKSQDQRGMQQSLNFGSQLLNDVSFSRDFLCCFKGISKCGASGSRDLEMLEMELPGLIADLGPSLVAQRGKNLPSMKEVQLSWPVVSDSLGSLGLQNARPPCQSPTPRDHSNSCPSSW